MTRSHIAIFVQEVIAAKSMISDAFRRLLSHSRGSFGGA
jgi:hypothetical protein